MIHTIPEFSGFGLGLRKEHYADFLAADVPVDFVEVISENFMRAGGRPLHTLEVVRARYPVALHGVSMLIGTAEGLNEDYLSALKNLADRIEPLWVSDHLCWTGTGGFNTHDLLPLPYTKAALDRVCANISHAQDVLERPMLFENPSSYIAFPDADMTEWEFLSAMCERAAPGVTSPLEASCAKSSSTRRDSATGSAGMATGADHRGWTGAEADRCCAGAAARSGRRSLSTSGISIPAWRSCSRR